MAYILGFIIADGCIYNNRLSFNLSKKDLDILKFIKKEISPQSKLRPEHNRFYNSICYELKINSKKICDSLKKFGIVKAKTGKECIPKIPKKYLPSLIRGIFDGDGCISKSEKYKLVQITVPSIKLGNQIKKVLKIGTVRKRKTKENRKDLYDWRIKSIKDVEQFKNYIYSTPGFYLKRKHKRFFSDISTWKIG
jgi:intein/homing endonuclease